MSHSLPVTEPVLVFALLMGIILVVPMLCKRFGVPDIVGLILAGVALGPKGLHILERGEAIVLFGTVGLLYILFIAGLEINLTVFNRVRSRSLSFGLLTCAIPLVLGTFVGRMLGYDWMSSVLLASMFASHTLLAYPIASRLGIANREAVTVAVGGTMITDLIALLILAVIADKVRGASGLFWIRLPIALGLLGLFLLYALPALSRWFFRHLREQGGAQFLYVMVTVFISAFLAEVAGIEALIGAFAAGIALSPLIPSNSALQSRLHFVGHTLFIPFFLISVGMLVDLHAWILSPWSWLVSAAMVVTVCLSKYLAALVTRRLFRYSLAEMWVVFGLSLVQAAATLAAVIIGYQLKLFDDAVLNGAIMMILVTCVIGPWFVEKYGRQMAASEPPTTSSAGGVPDHQRLLIPVANPVTVTPIMEFACLLRMRSVPGAIYPLAVVTETGESGRAVAEAEERLAQSLTVAIAADMRVSALVRLDMNVAEGILRAGREVRATATILGWHGDVSPGALIFGGLLDQLVSDCPARLYVCRFTHPLNLTRRVLLVLPPAIHHEPDFPFLMREIRHLAYQVGARLEVLATPAAAARGKPLLEVGRPVIPVTWTFRPSWSDLVELASAPAPDDLLVMALTRRLSLAWQPSLERLPASVAQAHPQVNFLAVYPATAVASATAEDLFQPPPRQIPPPLVRTAPSGESWDAAVRHLLADYLHPPAEAVDRCIHDLGEAGVELTPGVVLLHGRFPWVDENVLLASFSTEGIPLPGIAHPCRLLLLLSGPDSLSPEDHLRCLSELARRLHVAATGGKLDGLANAAQVERLFSTTPDA